jgi:dTDP-4-dehydrorhamnose 3,5-epimerase
MSIEKTNIEGFYQIRNEVHLDERGSFEQWFTNHKYSDKIKEFQPVQANTSTSKKGVIRGIHYSTSKEGQSKMVICVSGKIRDVAVDLREDSPTLGQYDIIDMEGGSGNVTFIEAGLGHAFEVLSDSATIVYLLSSIHSPYFEKEINALDKTLNINWVSENPILSEKDRNAQSFNDYLSKKKD